MSRKTKQYESQLTEADLALARTRVACFQYVASKATTDLADTLAHAIAEYEEYMVASEPSMAKQPGNLRWAATAAVTKHLGVTDDLIDSMKATLAEGRSKSIRRQ